MMDRNVEFEWDEAKAESNLEKHGVSFLTAAQVFAHPIVETIDIRRDYGEVRWLALGICDALMYQVVYTWRQGRIRIISARKANRNEQENYDRAIHHAANRGDAGSR